MNDVYDMGNGSDSDEPLTFEEIKNMLVAEEAAEEVEGIPIKEGSDA